MPPRKRWKGSAGKSATKRCKHSSQNGYEKGEEQRKRWRREERRERWTGEEQRKALEEGGAAQALAGGKAGKR